MSNPPDGDFIPMVDEQGRVTGVMDRATADYLASTDPNPTQASLDAVLSRATRARLLGSRVDENRRYQFDVVRLDITDPADLAELREALRIIEDPEQFGHLMSIESHRLEFWAGDECLSGLGVLYWFALRWHSVWKNDAVLANPRRFEDWLQRHGIPDATQQREADERRAEVQQRQIERWEQALPPCLATLWPDRLGDMNPDVSSARQLLEEAVPDPVEQARVLFAWFGSGAGPWSGYPAYESVPESMLLDYPIEILVRAVDRADVTDAQILGAARFFGGWTFGQRRKRDRASCSASLRQQMATLVERQRITDNVERFRRAFTRVD